MIQFRVTNVQHDYRANKVTIILVGSDGTHIHISSLPFDPPDETRKDSLEGEALKAAKLILYAASIS